MANERDGAAKEGGKGHEEAVFFAGVAGGLTSFAIMQWLDRSAKNNGGK